MTIELWFLIQLDNGKEYDKDKDENDGKEFILLYGAPGVDLLAAVSSESKNLYSLPTNPTHPPLCYCWWHNLHWVFQWEFLCCIFAVYKFSWFSNVRFLLGVHCMRIAWRSITISIWHAKRDKLKWTYDPLTEVLVFHMHRLTFETRCQKGWPPFAPMPILWNCIIRAKLQRKASCPSYSGQVQSFYGAG